MRGDLEASEVFVGHLNRGVIPRRLVVQGLYRYVRNPMYAGVLLVIVGEAVLRRSWQTVEYAVVVAVMFAGVVVLLEEPLLRSPFGTAYSQYGSEVPRWLPRRSPPAK